MKKLILLSVSLVLLITLNSCTADELPTKPEPQTEINQEGEIIPPIVIKP
ncbi:hypothetical protein [Flavobacterium sp.]|nr:hypothetical protein [Flavobacterium sp.]HLP63217.1 hypothetical protein [Flavobacterium sp.]